MASQKPFPLYTDGASVFYTTDGVNFNQLGGGGGAVASVTGVSAGIVDNTDPANPIIEAQFGSDTTVKLPNSGATLVKAWEQIITLSTNTPAAEVSQVVLKLLSAGAQTVEMTITPSAITLVPTLLIPSGSQGAPGIAFSAAPNVGFYYAGGLQIGIGGNTTSYGIFGQGSWTITQSNATLSFGSSGGNIALSSGNLIITPASTFYLAVGAARFELAKGADVASAQPLALGTDGNYFSITGTTGVQGIVTTKWLAGSKVALQLASGITITHNSGTPGASAAAILLRAAADLTTSGVYVLELYFNGTNWIQPS